MNKKQINTLIPLAYEALKNTGIAENGVINKTYCGQISTFGAAINMGSLLPAIAFFSEKGGSSVDRQKLMDAIFCTLKSANIIPEQDKEKNLFEYAKSSNQEEEKEKKEHIIDAAIALKLSMNLYQLEKQENQE